MKNYIDKTIGVFRFNLKLLMKSKDIKVKGNRHYLGRFAKIRTEEHGKISIGTKLYLSERSVIGSYKDGNLLIGNDNFFNSNCNITCYYNITIGNDNLFAQNVIIIDQNHNYSQQGELIRKQGYICKPVIIGSDCWICANVVICPGSIIGDHIIVAANSVVNDTLIIPGVYAGAPAKLIKKYE